MATATASAPSREDFAKLLDEAFGGGNLQEGSVIKGTVVGIEKDLAVIDVGLKTEGRVALREFTGPGRQGEIKIGDTVEVYLERGCRATRRGARRAGASSNRPSRTTRRSRASSSTR
jgi:small subunit ribosomal protein S1